MLGDYPKKGEIVDLGELPDRTVIAPGALHITEVDVPVKLENGTVIGKARVVEGDGDEVSVLVELEATNPIVADLFKSRMVSLSIDQSNDVPMIES